MVNAGIILRDGSWKDGKISQGYRFTYKYVVVGYKWVTVQNWPIKKRESKDGKINGEMRRWQKRVENCVGKWYDEGLNIDYERAVQALDSIYAEAVFKANALRRKRVSIEIIKAAVRRNSWQYAIDELKAGNFRDFMPDDYGYRVHTAFSQLKREFRCMVTYNGEQLVEVDIKNSQLYFMVYLLNWRNWNIRGESDEKTRKIWKGITTPTIDNKHPYTHTIMFLKSLESKYSKGFHEHDFVRSVTEGTLYESIMEKLMLSAGGTAKLSWYNNRDDVKKVLLMQLFADRWKHANSLFNCNSLPVWKTFETLYPDIGKIIREVKADYFKHISMLLQRIESMAVFGVCEHLFRHFPDVPYFTIHDCIVTMERNALTVKAVMEKCITDFIGYTKAGS